MAFAFVHEIKLASDEIYEGGSTTGTAIEEGLMWSVDTIDSAQSFTLSDDMTGFLICVANDAATPILARVGQAASAAPDGEQGSVVILQGSERYIKAAAGDQVFLTEAA